MQHAAHKPCSLVSRSNSGLGSSCRDQVFGAGELPSKNNAGWLWHPPLLGAGNNQCNRLGGQIAMGLFAKMLLLL